MAEPESKRLKQDPLSSWALNGSGEVLGREDAILALEAFIQANFTGPKINDVPTLKSALELLSSDGEIASHLTELPQLLYTAIQNLSSERDPIWLARALVVQQSILSNPSETLREKIFSLYTEENIAKFIEGIEDPDAEALIYTEVAKAHLVYDQLEPAADWLKRAETTSGLTWRLTGIAGRRTKFQQHDVAQLVCLAVSRSEDVASAPTPAAAPKAVGLDSDLLLERLSYTQAASEELPEVLRALDPNSQPTLRNVDNAILILYAELYRKSTSHVDTVVAEKRISIVTRVVENPESTVSWSIFSRALWNRSILESESSRTVERGTLQMQSLVEELGYVQTSFLGGNLETSNAEERLRYIHTLPPIPRWAMDIALAERFVSVGIVKSALEIYERLELWADAALLYALIGQESKGLELLDTYLEKNPKDARAWSIKGDITLDPHFWLKSWEVGHYAASKRSLGRFYLNPPKESGIERNLDTAADHLRDSLNVNQLNSDAWFLLGFIGLEKNDFPLAAQAFKQYVALSPEDSKGWSNLGSALLRMGLAEQAHHALKQAIRSDRNAEPNWRVWSNFVTIGAEIGDWESVIEGLSRILKMRSDKQDKFIHSSILHEVVQVFVQQEYEQTFIQDAMINLFCTDLPGVITNDADLYKLVAKVELWRGRPWEALANYEKGFRIAVNVADIDTNQKTWKSLARFGEELVDAYRNLGDKEGRMEGSKVCPDWQFKARTALRSTLSKGKMSWEDTPEYERLQALKSEI